MHKYKFDGSFETIFVDKEFLKLAEEYVIENIPPAFSISPDTVASKLRVILTDSAGEETLSTISDYRDSRLPDSTTTIELGLHAVPVLPVP